MSTSEPAPGWWIASDGRWYPPPPPPPHGAPPLAAAPPPFDAARLKPAPLSPAWPESPPDVARAAFCASCGMAASTGPYCPGCGQILMQQAGTAVLSAGPPSAGGHPRGLWPQRLRRLVSIRILFGCWLVSVLVAVIPTMIWRPLGWVWLPVFAVLLLGAVFNDDMVLECPHCRKRVKAGADTCHHCGRSVQAS